MRQKFTEDNFDFQKEKLSEKWILQYTLRSFLVSLISMYRRTKHVLDDDLFNF